MDRPSNSQYAERSMGPLASVSTEANNPVCSQGNLRKLLGSWSGESPSIFYLICSDWTSFLKSCVASAWQWGHWYTWGKIDWNRCLLEGCSQAEERSRWRVHSIAPNVDLLWSSSLWRHFRISCPISWSSFVIRWELLWLALWISIHV